MCALDKYAQYSTFINFCECIWRFFLGKDGTKFDAISYRSNIFPHVLYHKFGIRQSFNYENKQ